eukprot:6203843-Pleurochrysis_carterae.AAC.2
MSVMDELSIGTRIAWPLSLPLSSGKTCAPHNARTRASRCCTHATFAQMPTLASCPPGASA